MTNREDLLNRISIDPNVSFGKPCLRGTRIWVSLIVDNLAEGVPEAELLRAYPQLQPEGHSRRAGLRCRNDSRTDHPAPAKAQPVKS